jgi:hypothetical protein
LGLGRVPGFREVPGSGVALRHRSDVRLDNILLALAWMHLKKEFRNT